MNRFVVVALSLVLALPFAAFAEVNPDAYWYPMEDGSYGYDTEGYEHDLAIDMVQSSGVDLDPEQYWKLDLTATNELFYTYDFDAFKADYDALIEALSPVVEVPDDEEVPDPYPVEWPEEDLGSEMDLGMSDNENILQMDEINPVPDMEESSPLVYVLNDLRADAGVSDVVLSDGLKGVIQSIFGVYEPVTTTAAFTETVDGETITTLVDVVAEGAAGIDFEYISGVILFGVMLFCLFKLLGGILS